MYTTILPVVFGLFHVLKANKPSPNFCVKASKKCSDDVFMCGLAYRRFEYACGFEAKTMSTRSNQNWTSLTPPTPKPCSKECTAAIKGLKRTKTGKELHECDCQLDGHCLMIKARVAKCLNPTKNHGPYISCTVALGDCKRDPSCKSLQSKFLEDCGEMINGVRCEEKCLKIQEMLNTSTYGRYLAHCECDGPGEAHCRGIRAHGQQLRCIPGMDGSGTPAFTIVEDIIHGTVESPNNNTDNIQSPSWTLLVLFLTLLLF